MTDETKGPYFADMDGDGIIIGPGVHAEALDGCALVAALDSEMHTAAYAADDSEADEAIEIAHDHVIALMNLAYAEGAKSR